MSSSYNFCKQFGPRSGPTKCLIWIQNVRHSDLIPEIIFSKGMTTKKHEKSPSMQSVNNEEFTVLTHHSEDHYDQTAYDQHNSLLLSENIYIGTD